jgi:diguanylate cyclase (GGDEF)-like protein
VQPSGCRVDYVGKSRACEPARENRVSQPDDKLTECEESGRPDLSDASRAFLIVIRGGMTGLMCRLRMGDTSIGRQVDADLRLLDDGVSRQHACVSYTGGGTATIRDLGSTNGTFVNGQRVAACALEDGDRIHLGPRSVVKYCLQDPIEESFQRQLFELATRDPLTGIANRRSFDDRFHAEFAWARRHGGPCSLILFDVDHFKAVNDLHGHAAGDQVLRHVALVVSGRLRREDHFARFGGEEFVVLARDLDERGALARADELREAVAQSPTRYDEREIPVTISLGVATFGPLVFADLEAMVREADRQLYRAKARGRNRVESAMTEGPATPGGEARG